MFSEPTRVERPADLRCPFCGWHRIPDLSKSAPPPDGFYERAERELVDHLGAGHASQMRHLVDRWQNDV